MDLIWFHRVLIAVAILFFAGYGTWEATAFIVAGSTRSLLLAIGCLAAAAGLSFYLYRLKRFLKLPD